MTEEQTENTEQQSPVNNLPPVKIAFIIDGQVVDVLHTDDRLAAIFLSQPEIIDVTDQFVDNPAKNMVGWSYDGTNFTAPEPEAPPAE